MRGDAAQRWPRIARELRRADGGAMRAVLDAVERALPGPAGPPDEAQTLAEVLAPVRAYLLWALHADRLFEGASVFAGEIAPAGRPPVHVRVELVALGVEDHRWATAPFSRPAG